MQYRHDVDGLRALAVLLILFFHAELANVPGGFIGVDVFFVISGYLITKLIRRELETGQFSFSNFYLRRLRRLAPALLFTLILTLVVGWVLLPPTLYQEAAQSSLATLFSVSNVFFWWQTGYFNTEAYYKPLLHTWSLAVEEQFYLIWPAILVLAGRRLSQAGLMGVLLVIFAVTLLASQGMLTDHSSAAFFLTPFRIYEFAIGAMLAISGIQARGQILSNTASMVGALIILYAASIFSDETPFPGITALAPTLGAALLIFAGPSAGMNRALALPPISYIGRISYSLYLVHWPVQVYYRLMYGRPESSAEILLVLAISIVFGAAMYHLVETPFRKKTGSTFNIPATTLVRGSAICVLVISLASLSIHLSRGVQTRFSPEIITLMDDLNKAIEQRHNEVRDWTCNATTGSVSTYFGDFSSCQPDEEENVVVILGDSHAADIYMGMRAAYPNLPIVQLTGNGCHLGKSMQHDDFCVQFFDHWQNWLHNNQERLAAIVYGQSGASMITRGVGGKELPDGRILGQLISNLGNFTPGDVPFFFWGPRPGFNPTIDIAIARSADREDLKQYYPKATFETERLLDNWLTNQFSEGPIAYRSSIETLCSTYCPTVTSEGELFVIDYAHWSPAGAESAVRQMIAATPELQEILDRLSN